MIECESLPRYTLEEALQRVACEIHSDGFAQRVRRALGDGVELSIGVRLTHNDNGGFNVIFGLSEIRHRQDLLNARRCP